MKTVNYQLLKEEKIKCTHCGDICENISNSYEGKYFCCEGCKNVYELLNENGLCTYYSLEEFPGLKQNIKIKEEYLFLENDEIKDKLIEFRNGDLVKITLFIPSIHCSSCLWLLENLHKLRPGVRRSEVNFTQKELTLFYNESQISLKEIASLLNILGYAPHFNLEQLSEKGKKKVNISDNLTYKLGIAGFCFGNIMLMSFPEYLGLEEITGSLGRFFGYMNLILSLPVFFYCDSDYFTSSWQALKNKFINLDLPIAAALLVVYLRSVFEVFSGTGMGYFDSFTGLVFFLLIGKWYQKKTFESISFERDFKSYFPVSVTKITGETERPVSLYDLEQDDLILIRNNELIPADGVIVKGRGEIDYSFVTGESEPIYKHSGEVVYAGGRQKGEALEIRINKKMSQSYFTQLWNLDIFRKDPILSFSGFANKTGKVFTILVLIMAALTFGYWMFVDNSKAIFAAASVLIVFCPCTLALSIPFCFSNTLKILGKNGLYLKNSDTVEVLADIDTIVFDKTGTITKGGESKAQFIGRNLKADDYNLIRSITRQSSHPLSKVILKSIPKGGYYQSTVFEEIPGKGLRGVFQNKLVMIGSSEFILGKSERSESGSKVYIRFEEEVIGHFLIENSLREGIEELIKNTSGKYEIHLISGDTSFRKKEIESLFPNKNNVHFGLDPIQKVNYIKSLQEQGKKVMMVGDGLNDAGALKQSNAGIAVSDNVYNFSPSCDAIIGSSQLKDLLKYLKYCITARTLVKISLFISLIYNITGLGFAVTANLSPLIAAILMPASSVSVVLFVTVAGNLFAKSRKLI